MQKAASLTYQTTLHVKDACLCLHVQRAARVLARKFDEALRPFGLTNGQFSLLMSLNRPEPPPMGPVAELLAMDLTTLTAAVKRLQRNGLMKSLTNPRDRRSRLLELTPKGRAVLEKCLPIWESTHAEFEAQLRGNEDHLRRLLNSLL